MYIIDGGPEISYKYIKDIFKLNVMLFSGVNVPEFVSRTTLPALI